jgi:trehalose 6-phosphate phosphatase
LLEPRTEAGRLGLDALRSRPSEALLALDYDGTLAPIVADPTTAAPAEGAVDALLDLAALVGGIAVITGRPAETVLELGDLQRVPGLVILGQYGVQRWSGGTVSAAPPEPGLDAARAALSALELVPGAQVEDKGLSLAVHTRQADDPVVAMARLHPMVARIAADTGLALHLGRLVLELRPVGFDKGRALLDVAAGDRAGASGTAPVPFETVVFAGDDIGDLAAFDAVDQLRSRGNAGLLVCSASSEMPAELEARADLVVPGPPGVVALLRELLGS